jgi:hypothetical protein
MATERKAESKLTEAAAKTTAVLQTLQSRLNRETTPGETRDELGEQLKNYFATLPADAPQPTKVPNEIRNLVIEGVVERILRSWGASDGQLSAGFKSEVIGRLVERVLAELLKPSATPGSQSSAG